MSTDGFAAPLRVDEEKERDGLKQNIIFTLSGVAMIVFFVHVYKDLCVYVLSMYKSRQRGCLLSSAIPLPGSLSLFFMACCTRRLNKTTYLKQRCDFSTVFVEKQNWDGLKEKVGQSRLRGIRARKIPLLTLRSLSVSFPPDEPSNTALLPRRSSFSFSLHLSLGRCFYLVCAFGF